MTRRLLGATALLLSAVLDPVRAAAPVPWHPDRGPIAPIDPHSFSRPAEVAVRHLELDLAVDFADRRLTGSATLTLERRDPAATTLLPRHPRSRDRRRPPRRCLLAAPFTLAPAVPIFGQELAIALAPETRTVRIDYRTRPEAAALQWLSPEQTAGGKSPFLFTQSQAILARTWVPCQDSPGVRMTYGATIRVPQELLALMSAANPTARNASGDLPLRDDPSDPVVSAGAGGRGSRVSQPGGALWRLRRAFRRRQGGLGVRRHGEDDRRRRAALRPLSLGALRPAGAAAELSLRRHGESPSDLRHPDDPRRRPLAGVARGPRARPLLVRQPGDQRDLERLLAQRGLHQLLREPDHGGALRPRLLRDAGPAVESASSRSSSARPEPEVATPGWRSISPAATRRRPGGDRLRQGLFLSPPPGGDRRPRELGRASCRLLLRPCLPVDDHHRLRRRAAGEAPRRRPGRRDQGRACRPGSTDPGCRRGSPNRSRRRSGRSTPSSPAWAPARRRPHSRPPAG